MSLIPCKECEKSISNKANSCPHCGHPQNPENSGCILTSGCVGFLTIIIIVLMIIIYAILDMLTEFTSSIWNAAYGS
jgi:hypothetical protein